MKFLFICAFGRLSHSCPVAAKAESALRFLLLVFFLAPPFGPASASSPAARPVFDSSGAFGFCLIEHDGAEGHKASVALSPADEINLGVTIPGGRFTPDGKYDLTLSLDRAAQPETPERPFVRDVRAVALDETSLLFQMGKSAAFEKALASSRRLTVSGGGKDVAFDLPSAGTALSLLKDCVTKNRKRTKAVRPQAAAKDAKGAKGPDALASFLALAGFNDAVFLDISHIPENRRPSDRMWRTGHLLGGVREQPAPRDKSLTELTGLHLQGLKKQCGGAFKASVAREQQAPGLRLGTAEAECLMKKKSDEGKEEDRSLAVALLLYVNQAGTFTVFTHESAEGRKKEAIAARDQLKRTLLDVANGKSGRKQLDYDRP